MLKWQSNDNNNNNNNKCKLRNRNCFQKFACINQVWNSIIQYYNAVGLISIISSASSGDSVVIKLLLSRVSVVSVFWVSKGKTSRRIFRALPVTCACSSGAFIHCYPIATTPCSKTENNNNNNNKNNDNNNKHNDKAHRNQYRARYRKMTKNITLWWQFWWLAHEDYFITFITLVPIIISLSEWNSTELIHFVAIDGHVTNS